MPREHTSVVWRCHLAQSPWSSISQKPYQSPHSIASIPLSRLQYRCSLENLLIEWNVERCSSAHLLATWRRTTTHLIPNITRLRIISVLLGTSTMMITACLCLFNNDEGFAAGLFSVSAVQSQLLFVLLQPSGEYTTKRQWSCCCLDDSGQLMVVASDDDGVSVDDLLWVDLRNRGWVVSTSSRASPYWTLQTPSRDHHPVSHFIIPTTTPKHPHKLSDAPPYYHQHHTTTITTSQSLSSTFLVGEVEFAHQVRDHRRWTPWDACSTANASTLPPTIKFITTHYHHYHSTSLLLATMSSVLASRTNHPSAPLSPSQHYMHCLPPTVTLLCSSVPSSHYHCVRITHQQRTRILR